MKKILLLTTGGTIASQMGHSGLEPTLSSEVLLDCLNSFEPRFEIDHEKLFDMDSSNIQPEEWQIIARKIFGHLQNYDGFIITHGTDTLAYTASAVSYMLQNVNKSVVFTGSQIPINNPLSDARTNLYTAMSAINAGILGVTVAFDRKIMRGTRAVKVSTMGFDAFHSVNAACLAQIYADGLRVFEHQDPAASPDKRPALLDGISTSVFLLKLIPGTSPDILDVLPALGYKGVVIEAFGAGGIHYLHRDLLHKLKMLSDAGVLVVICSQCLYDRSDLTIYEVGQRVLSTGAISALDMTTEAAVTKLMWILGQTCDNSQARQLFAANLAGEIDSRLA